MKKFHLINGITQTIILGLILILLYKLLINNDFSKRNNNDYLQAKSRIVEVNTIANPIIGDSNALVELIVFSDFECPYCYLLYQQIENIAFDYIKNGQLKFVFFNYPLGTHKKASLLARISEYAYEKNNFEEVYKYIFENHSLINRDTYSELLIDFFPDTADFKIYIDKSNPMLSEDIQRARNIGIKGTPVFIVNNKLYLGIRTDEEFKEIIDNAIIEKEMMCE